MPRTPDPVGFCASKASVSLPQTAIRVIQLPNLGLTMNPSWHNASKSRPCPVCGHKDWCTISNDGEVAVCRRVPSPKPARSGIGWVHFLKDAPNRAPRARRSCVSLPGVAACGA